MKDKDKKKKKSKDGKKAIKKEKTVQTKTEATEEKKKKKKTAAEKSSKKKGAAEGPAKRITEAERPTERITEAEGPAERITEAEGPAANEAVDKKAAATAKEKIVVKDGAADKRAVEITKDKSADIKNNTNGEKNINDCLIHSLRDMSHTMRALSEGKGSRQQVLIVLWENGAMTQRALTERLGIRPGSASEVIAKLEDGGLLVRTPSKEDKRTADIALTEEGKRHAAEAAAQQSRRHQEMFSCLTDAEKEQLLALLETVNADWAQRYRHIERGK